MKNFSHRHQLVSHGNTRFISQNVLKNVGEGIEDGVEFVVDKIAGTPDSRIKNVLDAAIEEDPNSQVKLKNIDKAVSLSGEEDGTQFRLTLWVNEEKEAGRTMWSYKKQGAQPFQGGIKREESLTTLPDVATIDVKSGKGLSFIKNKDGNYEVEFRDDNGSVSTTYIYSPEDFNEIVEIFQRRGENLEEVEKAARERQGAVKYGAIIKQGKQSRSGLGEEVELTQAETTLEEELNG
jgi:hypothetical protein